MLYLENLWNLFVDMSFYIVIGIIFTGILHAFVNKDVILKNIGKNNTSSVVKASIFGVPLPLCSCGVVPTAIYLGENGASKGAVVSFLTSTPQTGVDSIIATYGLMGPVFAVFRAIAAFLSGIFAGLMTCIFCKNDKIKSKKSAKTSCCSSKKEEVAKESSCCCSSKKEKTVEESSCCCSSKKEEIVEESSCCCSSKKEEVAKESSCCCSSKKEEIATNLSLTQKIKSIFTFGFGSFLDKISLNFVIGLLIAALISTVIPADFLSSFSNPIITMLLMLIVGIPMYVCSTASIPIALSFIMKGISPGSAFVFLFAGPITNIASLTILVKTLGKKVTAVYLLSVGVCAVGFGLLLDYVLKIFTVDGVNNVTAHMHSGEKPIYMIVVAVIFGILVLRSLFLKLNSR